LKKLSTPKTGRPRRGYWEITDLGYQFLEGAATIPRMIQVLDKVVIFESPERITFQQAMQMTGEFSKPVILLPATPIVSTPVPDSIF
jgi:hypothetical protein